MRDESRDRDARWLHGHHHGQNSDRGNYTVDSHFNRGYGDNANSQYGDDSSFNTNADQGYMSPQGRFRSGGASYSGEDFTRGNGNQSNPYGMNYFEDDRYNSGRHFDPQADYSDHDYSDFRDNRAPRNRGGVGRDFGHDVRQGDHAGNWSRGSRGDYESYRRYEQGNPNYDNDYSGGFAGRNYTSGQSQYGEDNRNRDFEDRRRQDRQGYEDYMRQRDRR